MQYLYETERQNYEDFSSGRVLYSQGGTTSFPVRLGSEIYLRCHRHLMDLGVKAPYTLYDPCCGGAYLLSTLGFLHGKNFARIIASDIDQQVLSLAESNLALLTPAGMERRIEQIKGYIHEFAKESHKEALASALRLEKGVQELANHQLMVACFQADALTLEETRVQAELIITDVPYGNLAQWSNDGDVARLLQSIKHVLKPVAVVAIITDKKQTALAEGYRVLERFKAGKRQVTILHSI